jgi:hypothetical protein
MARAEVYGKWSTQGEGRRGSGGWSLFGTGLAAGGGGGIIALNQHAERVAWKEAWGDIRTRVASTRASFGGAKYQVKFWVDQQICPSCQKWLIIDVISHLKQLSQQNGGLSVELHAEVLFAGVTRSVRVQRSTVWPVSIGHTANYADLPDVYN